MQRRFMILLWNLQKTLLITDSFASTAPFLITKRQSFTLVQRYLFNVIINEVLYAAQCISYLHRVYA